ncbi:MAG: hypothetical protein KBT03_03870 [Bacteroidales bacterium]|nr:hypothetical protein [Candidatus Scybalousia scybalohippi]
MTGEYSLSDIAAVSGNNNGFGGNDGWWIILLFIFIAAGNWGNNGGAFGGNGGGYVSDNYALVTDNATLERKIDGVYSGICDSTFALNNTITNGFASAQNTMTQGFAGLNTALVQQGYEGRIATQGVGSQLAQCCCDLRQQISDVNYNIATQANGIGRQIENGFAQTNYNMASQNCQTLQAIDKVGDRVIDYLSQQENQRLRDEVAQYRAHANSQYVINELTPKCPIPAYLTCNPNAPLNYSVVTNSGCGCA